MKTDEWITGDKLYSTVFRKYSYFEEYNDKEACIYDGWINLSARGRKAAKASKDKVTRDLKTGRFAKVEFKAYGRIPHGKAIRLSSTLSGQRELLRNHENRLRALESRLCNCPHIPIRQDGANTIATGTC